MVTGCLLVVLLGGCGVIRDRSNDYVKTAAGHPIKTTPWDNSASIKPAYPVPPMDRPPLVVAEDFDFQIPRPPDLAANVLDVDLLVEEVDGQTWLLVNQVPGRVWADVSAFLNQKGLDVEQDNPLRGLMQTGAADFSRKASEWLNLSPDNATMSRTHILTFLQPGVRRATTEVQFRVIRKPASAEAQALMAWPEKPVQPEMEKQLLGQLADFLRTRDDSKSFSRLALQIPADPKVKLMTDAQGEHYVVLKVGFARAWSEVTRAVAESGLVTADINRSEGLWLLDARNEDEKDTGWFNWFGDAPEAVATHQLRLIQVDNQWTLRIIEMPTYEGALRGAQLLAKIFEHLY